MPASPKPIWQSTHPETPQWDAINEAIEATKLAPHDEAAKLLLARALVIHRRFAEARNVVDTLKAIDPDSLQVIQLEGVVATGLNQLPEAVAAFSKAVKLKDNALDRRRLAEAEIGLGRVDEAGQTMKTRLDAHPEDPERRREWADRRVKDGRFAEAAAQYAELVVRQPQDAALHNNLASSLRPNGSDRRGAGPGARGRGAIKFGRFP